MFLHGFDSTGWACSEFIEEHKAFVDFSPATHFSRGTTEFQIHHHTKRIGVQVGNPIHTIFSTRQNAIQRRIDRGHIRHGNIVDIDFKGPFVHSFTNINLHKPCSTQIFYQEEKVTFLRGRKEIVIRNGILGIIELIGLRQMGINRLSSIAQAVTFTKKILYDFDGFDNLRIMGRLIIDFLLRLESRMFDTLHLFHDVPLIKQIGTRP